MDPELSLNESRTKSIKNDIENPIEIEFTTSEISLEEGMVNMNFSQEFINKFNKLSLQKNRNVFNWLNECII